MYYFRKYNSKNEPKKGQNGYIGTTEDLYMPIFVFSSLIVS